MERLSSALLEKKIGQSILGKVRLVTDHHDDYDEILVGSTMIIAVSSEQVAGVVKHRIYQPLHYTAPI